MAKMSRMKERRQELGNELKKGLVSYFKDASVRGFKYVVDGRNIFERVMWTLFIAVEFICCGLIVYNTYQYWEDHPVETTIDAVGLPVQELPFPAITVCDTKSLQMPRRNRWMFLETLLNSLELIAPNELINQMETLIIEVTSMIIAFLYLVKMLLKMVIGI